MEFVQTRDILQKAADFHSRLSSFYADEEQGPKSPKVKLLLSYLARHEKNLALLMDKCPYKSDSGITNTWFKYKSDELSQLINSERHIPDDSTLDDILKIALEMDHLLLEFYSDAANMAMSEDVREFFENLASKEEQEEHKLTLAAFDGF